MRRDRPAVRPPGDVTSPCRQGRGEDGFGLAEILAATLILVIVIISFSNLLIDSLSAALISRQREAAASIASDMIENATALGQTALTGALTTALLVAAPVCTLASSIALFKLNPLALPSLTPVAISPVPVLTQLTFLTPYLTKVNSTVFTVCSTITAPSSGADTVSVLVTWSSGKQSFGTDILVGS